MLVSASDGPQLILSLLHSEPLHAHVPWQLRSAGSDKRVWGMAEEGRGNMHRDTAEGGLSMNGLQDDGLWQLGSAWLHVA